MITINECIYKILSCLIKNTTTYITGRKLTYPIDHYISVIFKVLATGCQWNSLNEKLHYSVYNKHFIKWSKYGIFNELHKIIIKMVSKLKNISSNYYIDSTIIRNIGGISDVSFNYKIKSKKGTKVSIIVNSKGIPVSIHIVSSNFHDVSLVLPNYYKLDKKIKIKNLIGDAGYVSNKLKNYFKNKHNINYIYPDKINITNNLTSPDKLLLKTRMINEHSFSWLTQYRRLTCRYEKYTHTFASFIILAFSNITLNKINN